MSSTNIQWTMKLSDAALITNILLEAAESAESQANYLESESYAEKQQDKPDSIKKRINEYRQRAARLRELIES